MSKRTPYQDRVIRDYYKNQDSILLQRLGDLVTDLYLAEGAKRAKIWTRVSDILEKLKVPQDRARHLIASDNPALLAGLLKELLDKKEIK
jgi:hypothetical protein